MDPLHRVLHCHGGQAGEGGYECRRRVAVGKWSIPLFRAATRRWYGPFARPERIVNVAVRDQDFQLIRVLESEGDLSRFASCGPPSSRSIAVATPGGPGNPITSSPFKRSGAAAASTTRAGIIFPAALSSCLR